MSEEASSILNPHVEASGSPLFELARVLVRLDHVASLIVNTNHDISQLSIRVVEWNHALNIATRIQNTNLT